MSSHFLYLKNRLQMAQAMLHGSILDEEDLLRKQQMVDELDSQLEDMKARKHAIDKRVEYLRNHVLGEFCKVLAKQLSCERADWNTLEDFMSKFLDARDEQKCFEPSDL